MSKVVKLQGFLLIVVGVFMVCFGAWELVKIAEYLYNL